MTIFNDYIGIIIILKKEEIYEKSIINIYNYFNSVNNF